MSDNEPIKHGIRKNVVALLSSMNALAQLDVKDRVSELKMSLKYVTEVASLLHVAITTGLVSQMNGELLMEGVRSLQHILEKKQPVFTAEMFSVEHEESLINEVTSAASSFSKSSYDHLTPPSIARLHESSHELRRTQESLRQDHLLSKVGGRPLREEIVKDKKIDIIKDSSYVQEKVSTHSVLIEHAKRPLDTLSSSFQMKKLSRREQILALFVKGVDVSIKDITSRIKGCSEKTIQRELNALLYDNIIERIGEKRWSRYVLK
jgi:hypothetical protein